MVTLRFSSPFSSNFFPTCSVSTTTLYSWNQNGRPCQFPHSTHITRVPAIIVQHASRPFPSRIHGPKGPLSNPQYTNIKWSLSVFGKHLKTHLFSHSFPESPVVPVQWLCHFWHYNRSFYLLTYLLEGISLWCQRWCHSPGRPPTPPTQLPSLGPWRWLVAPQDHARLDGRTHARGPCTGTAAAETYIIVTK